MLITIDILKLKQTMSRTFVLVRPDNIDPAVGTNCSITIGSNGFKTVCRFSGVGDLPRSRSQKSVLFDAILGISVITPWYFKKKRHDSKNYIIRC